MWYVFCFIIGGWFGYGIACLMMATKEANKENKE